MLNNEIGMKTRDVINIVKKNDYYIETEKKVEYDLLVLKDKLKKVYSSHNASVLNTNNNLISDSIHSKYKNLNSYNIYIQKCISRYVKASNNISQILREVFKGEKL